MQPPGLPPNGTRIRRNLLWLRSLSVWQHPCQLAWQVNQIAGYCRVIAGNLLHLRASSEGSSSSLTSACSHQSCSPTWRARGGLVRVSVDAKRLPSRDFRLNLPGGDLLGHRNALVALTDAAVKGAQRDMAGLSYLLRGHGEMPFWQSPVSPRIAPAFRMTYDCKVGNNGPVEGKSDGRARKPDTEAAASEAASLAKRLGGVGQVPETLWRLPCARQVVEEPLARKLGGSNASCQERGPADGGPNP